MLRSTEISWKAWYRLRQGTLPSLRIMRKDKQLTNRPEIMFPSVLDVPLLPADASNIRFTHLDQLYHPMFRPCGCC